MVPTIVPELFMPNTRGLLKSWLGKPGGTPKLVSTPLDQCASATDPSELAIPPATTPLLLRASPPVLEKGMKGSGVTSYRSSADGEYIGGLSDNFAPRQPQSVVGRPRHSWQDSHCGGIAGAPHQLDDVGSKLAEGVGKMLDWDAK